MKLLVAVAVVVAMAVPARADDKEGVNAMIGPIFGVRLGGPDGSRLIIGVEGGGGWGPERINLGYTQRLGKGFGYIELDPWYIVGASLGVGIDSDGKTHPVIGVWEGVPIRYPDCGDDGWQPVVTISVGYRWTGVHELYFAPKAGSIYDGGICIH